MNKIMAQKSWDKVGDIYLNVFASFEENEHSGETQLIIKMAQLPPAYDINNFKCKIKYPAKHVLFDAKAGYGPLTHSYDDFSVTYTGSKYIGMGSQSIDFGVGFDIVNGGEMKFDIIIDCYVNGEAYSNTLKFDVKV